MNPKEEVDVEDRKLILNNPNYDSSPANNHDKGLGDPSSEADDDSDRMSICSNVTSSPKKLVKSEHRDGDEPRTKLTNGEEFPEIAKEKFSREAVDDEVQGQNSDGPASPAKPTTPNLPNIAIRKREDLLAQTNYTLIQNRLQELYKKCKGSTFLGRTSSQIAFSSQQYPSSEPGKLSIGSQLQAHTERHSEDGVINFHAHQQNQYQSASNCTPYQPGKEEIDEKDIVEGSIESDDINLNVEDFDWSDGFDIPEGETAVQDEPAASEVPVKQAQHRKKISDYFQKTQKESVVMPLSSYPPSSTSKGLPGAANKPQKTNKAEEDSDINSAHGGVDPLSSCSDVKSEANTQKGLNEMHDRKTASYKFHEQSHMKSVVTQEVSHELNINESSVPQKKSVHDCGLQAREFHPNQLRNSQYTNSQQMLKPILTDGGPRRSIEHTRSSGQYGFDADNFHPFAKPSGRSLVEGNNSQILKQILTDRGSCSYTSPQTPNSRVPKRQLSKDNVDRNQGGNLASGDNYCSWTDSPTMELISTEMQGPSSSVKTDKSSQNPSSRRQLLKPILTDSGINFAQTRSNSKQRVQQQRKSGGEMVPGNLQSGTDVAYDLGKQNRTNAQTSEGSSSQVLDPMKNKVVEQERAKGIGNAQTSELAFARERFDSIPSNHTSNSQNIQRASGSSNPTTINSMSFGSEGSSPKASNAPKNKIALGGETQQNKRANASQNVESGLHRSVHLSSTKTKPNLKVGRNGTPPLSSDESDWDSQGSDADFRESDSDFQSPDSEKPKNKPTTVHNKTQELPSPSQIPVSLRNLSGVHVQWTKQSPNNSGNGSHQSAPSGNDHQKSAGSNKARRESALTREKRCPPYQELSSQKKAEAAVRHLPGIQIQQSKRVQKSTESSLVLSPVGCSDSPKKVNNGKSALGQKNGSLTSQQYAFTNREFSGQELPSSQNGQTLSVSSFTGVEIKRVQSSGRGDTPFLPPGRPNSDVERSSDSFNRPGTNQRSVRWIKTPTMACHEQQELQAGADRSLKLQSRLERSEISMSSGENLPGHPVQDEGNWNSSVDGSKFDTSSKIDHTLKPKSSTPLSGHATVAQNLPGIQNQHSVALNAVDTPKGVDIKHTDGNAHSTANVNTDINLRAEESSTDPAPPQDVSANNFNTSETALLDRSDQETSLQSDASSEMSIPAKRPKKAPLKSIKKSVSKPVSGPGSGPVSKIASGSQQHDPGSSNIASHPKKPITKKGSENSGVTSSKNNQKTNLLAYDTDSNDSFDVMRRRNGNDQNDVIPESEDSSSNQMPETFPDMFTESSLRPLFPVAVPDASTEMSPEKSYIDLESGVRTYTNLDVPRIPKYPQNPNSTSSRTPQPAQQPDFIDEDLQNAQNDLFQCVLCPLKFGSVGELEAHVAAEGHIVCSMSASCASLRFYSPASLAQHQFLVHQQSSQQTSAFQGLATPVERIPQAFGGYPPPQANSYGSPSSSFNGPKLGSQVVLTSMSTPATLPAAPPPSLRNLPAGIQLTKRPAPTAEASHSPSKVSRTDNGMPSVRLPGSITLVRSQPAPLPQNRTDALANRGVTLLSSGSRGNQSTAAQSTSPAKRLPNLPAGISISSSHPQSSPSNTQQNKRFAVPPAPVRGRHATNLGSIDLTKEESNRARGRPPMVGTPQKKATCTICDKVFATQEALQAHMTVHGSKRRFMCEICRVVYPNEGKLAHHKKTVHAQSAEPTGPEFVIPICDINQQGVKQKLLQCGIRHIVQLSSLRNANDTATFGLPIIPIDLAKNEAFSRLDDLGSSNILSLGTLKNIR